ncbi:deaminase [Candidatus Nesciobacter abundans]|uniref:CMP/dCMP-type deaminase domain-containing protein n=1 Tax=Candidatus Nesciobacter abundans TaxID=2601668 RepID=A0A5C0UHT3_9PROT|nr:deaminase [Candidatus Nesciobacter abundans]QEK39133.1 hypothetical protein FZC36_01645 [Candidatus Nesciobacter abundans]
MYIDECRKWMSFVIELALKTKNHEEVPVACVILNKTLTNQSSSSLNKLQLKSTEPDRKTFHNNKNQKYSECISQINSNEYKNTNEYNNEYKYELVSKSSNQVQLKQNPLKHAELIALELALKKLNTKYLTNCILITNLEPCDMCMKAIELCKIKRVIFGAYRNNLNQNKLDNDLQENHKERHISNMQNNSQKHNTNYHSCKSHNNYHDYHYKNHSSHHIGGVMETECKKILQNFFKKIRERN